MTTINDMTTGKPRKLLVSFALPLLFGSIFQQCYTLADGAVVGRLIGVDAFAAVGAAGFLSWMVTSIILGLTQGFGILFAQRFGAKDHAGLRRGVSASLYLGGGIGVILTVAGLLCASPVLHIVETPDTILPGALLYLQWVFSGTLISMAYNIAATLLRSLGDSKTPLYALIFSGIANVLLDLLFVAGFSMGISGVAAGTVLAQLFSLLFCLFKLRKLRFLRLSSKELLPHGKTLWELLRLGAPLAFRDAVIAVGGLAVQSVINSYGRLFVAGTTAAKKYFGLMEMVGSALEGAASTFVAQNFGAKNMGRIREGMNSALRMEIVGAAVIGTVSVLGSPFLLSLLISGSAAEMQEIIAVGGKSMLAMAICLPFLYLLCLYRSGLQGMGNSLFSMLSGFLELLLRIFAVWFLPRFFGEWGVFFAEGLGWIGAFLLLCIAYYVVFRKQKAGLSRL